MPLVTFASVQQVVPLAAGQGHAQPKAVVVIVVISRESEWQGHFCLSLRHSRVDVTDSETVTRARSHAPARPPGPGPISSQVH